MKDIIRDILNKAYEEKDLDLANIANDLMGKLNITCNCPSDWKNIPCELAAEYKNNDWIMNAIYIFSYCSDDEEA